MCFVPPMFCVKFKPICSHSSVILLASIEWPSFLFRFNFIFFYFTDWWYTECVLLSYLDLIPFLPLFFKLILFIIWNLVRTLQIESQSSNFFLKCAYNVHVSLSIILNYYCWLGKITKLLSNEETINKLLIFKFINHILENRFDFVSIKDSLNLIYFYFC